MFVDVHVERRSVEVRIEAVGACDIEHRIDRMLVLRLRDFADGHVLVLLQVGPLALEHEDVVDRCW